MKIEDIDGQRNTIKRGLEGVQVGWAAFHGQKVESWLESGPTLLAKAKARAKVKAKLEE